MKRSNYNHLADIYEHLMKYIDYKDWAGYIKKIIEHLEIKNSKVLELAAGNGKLAFHLNEHVDHLIISDLSSQMLSHCDFNNIPRICCNMTALPFQQKFTFIFSTFDSVNYLVEESDFEKMLRSVSDCLLPNGYFTFDVSLKNNSLHFEKKLNRKGLFKGMKYIQKSIFFLDEQIHRNIFRIKLADGTIVEEKHYQKIFDYEYYFDSAERNGFIVNSCFETFTFNKADSNTGRAQFILQKKN